MEHNIASIGFPAISTGACGYQLYEGARIALNTAMKYDIGKKMNPKLIRFALWGNEDLSVLQSL